jgi:hypothetical protein
VSEVQSLIVEVSPRRWDWWKFGDGVVLLAYSAVVLWTLQYHEKWADEAQAWLIARDLDLKTIWFHELRYEGSPGLWHTILWVAQHVFHAGYGAIGYIGAAFAIAGAAVLLYCAPFPRYIRWPLAFTYVMVYQYAVIARPYTLLPFLAFLAACFFKDTKHPELLTIVLILLTLLTLHGAILAGCLGLAYLVDTFRQWPTLNAAVRWRYVSCTTLLGLTFLFLLFILKPGPDVEEFVMKGREADLAASLHVKPPTWDIKLSSVLAGAFLDFAFLSALFMVLAGAWCAIRKRLLLFAVPVVGLIVLYVVIHGYSHHHGTITTAAIVTFWIAWPTTEEVSGFSNRQLRANHGMVVLLLIFCAVQIWDSVGVIRNEYLYPYSGAENAAEFLKSEGAERSPIFGVLYGVAGIQPYFDHNIFANLSTSYFHHGLPLEGTTLELAVVARVKPGHIVVFTEQPQLMADSGQLNGLSVLGYEMVHFSDGYLLYRRGVYVRQSYFIFRREGWGHDAAHGNYRGLSTENDDARSADRRVR